MEQIYSFPKGQGQSDVAHVPSMGSQASGEGLEACGGAHLPERVPEGKLQLRKVGLARTIHRTGQGSPKLVFSVLALSFSSGSGYSWHPDPGLCRLYEAEGRRLVSKH